MGLTIVVPKVVPPGNSVPVKLQATSEWSGQIMTIEARWAPGTGYTAYNQIANKGGNLLVRKSWIVPPNGGEVDLGSYSQPADGSLVGVFIYYKAYPQGLFEYTTVNVGSWDVKSFNVNVNPASVVPGDKLDVKANIYWTGSYFNGHIEVDAFGHTYKSAPTQSNMSPLPFNISIKVPNVSAGKYNVTVKLVNDYTHAVVASKQFTVYVGTVSGQPSPQPSPTPTPTPTPSPTPTPTPTPTPQPGPTVKSWLPLIGIGAILLGMDYFGSKGRK